jgi:hypothetical protein
MSHRGAPNHVDVTSLWLPPERSAVRGGLERLVLRLGFAGGGAGWQTRRR